MRRRRGSKKNQSDLGDYWMIDDITGFKHKASEMRQLEGEDKGLYTHWQNWSPENPQLKIRSRGPDRQRVPVARPRTPDRFVTIFSETSLSNLQLMLDASVSDSVTRNTNDIVSAWADQQGSNNFSQNTPGNQPTYISTGMKGNPSIYFDGNDYLDTPSDFMTSNSYTIFLVIKFNPGVAEILHVEGTGATMQVLATSTQSNVTVISTATLSATIINTTEISEGAIFSITIDADNKTATLRTQGLEATDTDAAYAGGVFSGNNPLRIGDAYGGGFSGLVGNLSEILIYEGVKTTTEIQSMESYLNKKWFVL